MYALNNVRRERGGGVVKLNDVINTIKCIVAECLGYYTVSSYEGQITMDSRGLRTVPTIKDVLEPASSHF